ncbi:unnamed protein product [Cyclocybe aegerita]|uniref:Uncharacterized protein n=1 Tax=Cyclocybe aegerita TaxID=1973307 RepID=A0A8S0WZ53_CYCAE|nr:unnamed protein product [Cyclocybe aegerita]
MCQYHKKLKHRVSVNQYLEVPDIEIDKAIGLFHIHGHQDSCLFRYATTFIPGAAKINGEIMETLWAILNNISRASRTLMLAHCSEMYDDHMNDSNWKKQCGMVSHTTHKFEWVCNNVESSLEYYNKLTSVVDSAVVSKWTQEIEHAEAKRSKHPEAMDIMNTWVPKHTFIQFLDWDSDNNHKDIFSPYSR